MSDKKSKKGLGQKHSIHPNQRHMRDIVMSQLGHDQPSGCCDIADNMFDADATEAIIEIFEDSQSNIESYRFIDNGTGMDLEGLVKSFTFAGENKHAEGDLGKFGIGGSTALSTMAKTRKTITKTKDGDIIVGEQDLTDPNDKCDCIIPREATEEETRLFNSYLKNSGTIIEATNVRSDSSGYVSAAGLQNKLIKVLGATYYRRIQSGVKIWVNRPKAKNKDRKRMLVSAADPFYRLAENQDYVKSSYHDEVYHNGNLIRLHFMELNRHAEAEWDNQGLYYSRNERLIQAATSHYKLWRKHNNLNRGRVEISFSEELDEAFGLGALKNKVNPSQSLVDKLDIKIRAFYQQVRRNAINTTIEVPDDDLKKADQEFDKRLKAAASTLGLPKRSGSGGGGDFSILRGPNKNKSGSVSPKNTGKTRSGGDRLLTPTFTYVEEPRVPEPCWYDWSEGTMTVTVNKSHPFVKKYYGNSRSQSLLRKIFASSCFAAHKVGGYGTREEGLVQAFLKAQWTMLSDIDRNIT